MKRGFASVLMSVLCLAAIGCGPNQVRNGTNAVGNAIRNTGNAAANAAGVAGNAVGNAVGAAGRTTRRWMPQPGAAATNAGNAARPVPAPAGRRIRVEQSIANQVVRLAHVQSASVLVVGNTAYVAVVLRHGVSTGPANATKQHVASKIKATHPGIQTVFVSANPDVYQRFQNFTSDIARGRPVDAIWGNFTSYVQRIWPTTR
ncbi:MAG: YhcN/YlaJ family sporulation lipoprotein [Alicyclobacillus sp.]|nr:YhcN/YlaJ family sporulation lipoprotein [Alicyclobacillus sp.]